MALILRAVRVARFGDYMNRLQPKAGLDGFSSGLAQIAQVPQGFDFPRRNLPAAFYYTGPFVDRAARKEISFPWSQLDSSRPLVFVSMGALQNGIKEVYQVIVEVCAEFPVQTSSHSEDVCRRRFSASCQITNCGVLCSSIATAQPCCLTIFHGGLNTALESRAHGVPMIAIPVAFDQPGVGARLLWTGTAKMIPIRQLTVGRLRLAMGEILSNPQYQKNARLMQKQISVINGIKRAANRKNSRAAPLRSSRKRR